VLRATSVSSSKHPRFAPPVKRFLGFRGSGCISVPGWPFRQQILSDELSLPMPPIDPAMDQLQMEPRARKKKKANKLEFDASHLRDLEG